MFRRLAPALLLALAIILFFWKITLTTQYTWLASPDLTHMVMPWYQFETRELHHLRFPLWDPYSWAGHPFLAQAQPGLAYPLNWILFLLPFDHGWLSWAAMNWYYVLTRVAAALVFYWLCRDMGRSREASFAGGLTYGIAGYLGSVDWPQMVNGAVWVPAAFLFELRVLRQAPRSLQNGILSGFFLGLMWLAGHHQMPLFVTFASAGLWSFIVYQRRDRSSVQAAVAAVFTGILTGAFQTIPTAEYGRLARRWAAYGDPLKWNDQVPYTVHAEFSIKPLSLLNIVIPGLDHNIVIFVGMAALAFAVAGLISNWSDLRVKALASIALGGLLFALGPASVFHGILYSVAPMIEKARVPAQAAILFHLGACALFAFGIDSFGSLSRRAANRIAAVLLAAAAVIASIGLYAYATKALAMSGDSRFMAAALSALLSAALVLAWNRSALSARAAPVLLAAIVFFEAGNVTTYNWAHKDQKDRMADLEKLASDADIRQFIQSQPGSPRVAYDQDAIPHNIGHWWGLETFDAYQASVPDLLWRRQPFNSRTRALLGVRYWISTKPLSPDQAEVFRGASGRIVYQFPTWMPRAWTVHQVERVGDEQANRMLTDPGIDLRTRAFSTLEPPKLEQCAGADNVEMTRHMANTVTLIARMSCRGLVVLDDQFFPGWKATVDGRSAPVIDAYGLVRGVPVDSGTHTVEFRYSPWSVILGAILSATGALIALAASKR